MNNPDYRMYPHIFNVLTQKGQHMPPYFDLLIDPYDKEAAVEAAEKAIEQIKVPTYTGSGWYAYTYKTHLNGAQNYFEKTRGAEETDLHWARRISSGRSTRCTAKFCAGTITGSKISTPAS